MLFRTALFAFLLLFLSSCAKHTQQPKTDKKILQKFHQTKQENTTPKQRFAAAVDNWLGVRYCYAGESKKGVDCSALVQQIYKEAFGIKIPRTTKQQIRIGRKLTKITQLREGDILFFQTSFHTLHAAIYLQNGNFVHASSSHGVKLANIYNPYWKSRFKEARRLDALDLLLMP